MNRQIRLIVTDSYFNIFGILNKCLDGKTRGIGDGKNIIFSEEKISLMAERKILSEFKGTFNTDVFSFGNYVRKNGKFDKILSKEGSSMAIRKVISETQLKCLSGNKTNLSKAVFELISQLKSAKVTANDLLAAAESTSGILKNKLIDLGNIFNGYESFLSENGFEDQSSLLKYLPSILTEDKKIPLSDVYLLGYSSLTQQMLSGIEELIRRAKSVTAILIDGANKHLFLGETVRALKNLCEKSGVRLNEEIVKSDYSFESEKLKDFLFSPYVYSEQAVKSEKIYITNEKNPSAEIERIAETIKYSVIGNRARYKDFTVALGNAEEYKDLIAKAFNDLEIPFFLDEKRTAVNHPLIRLIVDYTEVLRKNFRRDSFISFFTNPLVSADKQFNDSFINYLEKYNVNYNKFKTPFIYGKEEDINKFEPIREQTVSLFNSFSPETLLEKLSAKEKVISLGEKLQSAGLNEDAAVNSQLYEKISAVLEEERAILGKEKVSLTEFKSLFLSAVSALEVSVIPQYNDAVFIGGFKETALSKATYLFVPGLTSDIPHAKDDVALISDAEINALIDVKVLIEPKIRVVNDRERESAGMAICAFDKALFLSCPVSLGGGKFAAKSEIIKNAEALFDARELKFSDGYLTERQGVKTFAKELGDFVSGKIDDIDNATAFYRINTKLGEAILEQANKEMIVRIDTKGRKIIPKSSSPTFIEDYFKCPYYAFCARTLKLKNKEDGVVRRQDVGTVVHEALERYIRTVYCESNEKPDSDEKRNRLFEKIADEILRRDEYSFIRADAKSAYALSEGIREAERYLKLCEKELDESGFLPYKTEAVIGEGGDYQPIVLSKGLAKITGKIDRIDQKDKIFRIIDYKTGKTETSDASLFTGRKLQLYLYASAVKDKEVYGAYYVPVEDSFKDKKYKKNFSFEGKTVSEEAENKRSFSPKDMKDYMDYAVKVSEKAVERISEGVVVPSPYEGVCSYCPYLGVCGGAEHVRKVGKVDKELLTLSVNDGGKDE